MNSRLRVPDPHQRREFSEYLKMKKVRIAVKISGSGMRFVFWFGLHVLTLVTCLSKFPDLSYLADNRNNNSVYCIKWLRESNNVSLVGRQVPTTYRH